MERARCQEDIRSVVLGPLKHHLYPTRTSCSWIFSDPGRLEEVRITAAGRPGFGELSGWMVGFIH